MPTIRQRPGGYGALFRIVVQQQLSLTSAASILARCEDALDITDPSVVASAPTTALKGLGLSAPKARYVHCAAEAVLSGALPIGRLGTLSDDAAMEALTAVTGIGPWSAAIYLLFCEGRLTVWPPNDVALLNAYRTASDSDVGVETQKDFDRHAQATFAPHGGLAAHVLWSYFHHLKGSSPT